MAQRQESLATQKSEVESLTDNAACQLKAISKYNGLRHAEQRFSQFWHILFATNPLTSDALRCFMRGPFHMASSVSSFTFPSTYFPSYITAGHNIAVMQNA